MKCGDCDNRINGECREGSPKVVVVTRDMGALASAFGGTVDVRTVWPKVSEDEAGCGRFTRADHDPECSYERERAAGHVWPPFPADNNDGKG